MGRPATGTDHYCPVCKNPVDQVDTICLACESSRPATGWPVDPFVGRILASKYRIDKRLKVGGFGAIFIATQVHKGQELGQVIIKMLHPEHALDPIVTRRFINEVKAARSVASPNVVKIFDVDFDQGNVPYMVQERVAGRGLAEILEREVRIGPARSVSIALQVAEGMEEAHLKNIIHRDLKPENIIVEARRRTDHVKIIDFGIAHVTGPGTPATTGFMGTPRYMPPEQIQGRKLDGRADIFALGVILFEMIAGRAPIEVRESDMEYLKRNLEEEPARLRLHDPEVPQALDDLVHRMMAKDPGGRPASMGDVARELRRIAVEHGYQDEISGLITVPDGSPGDTSSTQPDSAPAGAITEERPASAGTGEGRGFAMKALMAGAAAFVAVLAIGAVILALFGPCSGGPGSPASPVTSAPLPEPEPDTGAIDAPADPPPNPEPDTGALDAPADPPPTPPKPAKPPVKKKPDAKNPWTKI